MTTTLFSKVCDGLLPGDILDLNYESDEMVWNIVSGIRRITQTVSKSTLRRWEKKGWIKDMSTNHRLAVVVLTRHGYRTY